MAALEGRKPEVLARLAEVGEYTDEQLTRFIRFLPTQAQRRLAAGPLPEPHCRVCRVLMPLFPSGPASELFDVHADCLAAPTGKDVYAACLRIYRLAGWDG